MDDAGRLDPASASPVWQVVAGYQPALDGLRAVAISAVVLYHAERTVFPGGWIGVDVFFALSGFLITSLLVQEMARTRNIDVWRFYARRAVRVWPAFAALIVFSIVFATCLQTAYSNLNATLVAATYTMNWNRAFDVFPEGWLGHTWAVAEEQQFYLVWPAILLFIGFRNPARWLIAAIAAAVAWRIALIVSGESFERIYNGLDTHADPLLIGAALAFVPLTPTFTKNVKRLALAPIVVLAALILFARETSVFSQTIGYSATAGAATWVIVLVLTHHRLWAILSSAPFRYTGRISYSWYLWHFPILKIGYAHIGHFTGAGLFLCLLAYPVAMASYHFVEKPALRFKARIEPTKERTEEQLTAIGDAARVLASNALRSKAYFPR